MPGRDCPENLRNLKKTQLEFEIGPLRQKIEFSAIELRDGFGPLKT